MAAGGRLNSFIFSFLFDFSLGHHFSFFFSLFAKAHNLLLLPALVQSNEPSSGCVRLGHKKPLEISRLPLLLLLLLLRIYAMWPFLALRSQVFSLINERTTTMSCSGKESSAKRKKERKKYFLKESLCDRVLEEDMMQKIFEIFFLFF